MPRGSPPAFVSSWVSWFLSDSACFCCWAAVACSCSSSRLLLLEVGRLRLQRLALALELGGLRLERGLLALEARGVARPAARRRSPAADLLPQRLRRPRARRARPPGGAGRRPAPAAAASCARAADDDPAQALGLGAEPVGLGPDRRLGLRRRRGEPRLGGLGGRDHLAEARLARLALGLGGAVALQERLGALEEVAAAPADGRDLRLELGALGLDAALLGPEPLGLAPQLGRLRLQARLLGLELGLLGLQLGRLGLEGGLLLLALLLLGLELALEGVRLVLLLLDLGVGGRRRAELGRDQQRPVVARPEARRDQVVGLPLLGVASASRRRPPGRARARRAARSGRRAGRGSRRSRSAGAW